MHFIKIAAFAIVATAPSLSYADAETMSPVALDRAVDEFGKVCLTAYPDNRRLDYVLKKSDFGYTDMGQREWRSKYATVTDMAQKGEPSQCAFDAVLGQLDAKQDKVISAIEREIKSQIGLTPMRLVFKQGNKWEWQVGSDMHSVIYYFGAPINDRQLVLSYRIEQKG